MTSDGIRIVTAALRDRLQQALQASGMPGTVFVGPLDDPDAGGAALVLFLYRIVPCASLRNSEHRVPSGDPAAPAQVYRGALPLDLSYLLTVGTTPGGSEEAQLRNLGVAMQALQAEPDLGGTAVAGEVVHVTLEPLGTEEASRIWTLFPTANYRTSVAYLATPVWIDPRREDRPAREVVRDTLRDGQRALEVAP